MSIERELFYFLDRIITQSDNKHRDIEIINYYYGFRGDIEPTLEDAAIKYSVGDTDGRRSERPRQIIKTFKDNVKAENLPSLIECAEIIKSHQFISLDKLFEALIEKRILQSNISFIGLMKLLDELNLCEGIKIYTPKLIEANKHTYLSSKKAFLIHDDVLPVLKTGLSVAKTLPGLCGIARISNLRGRLGNEFAYFDEIVEILRADEDAWFEEFDVEMFYLIETRDNTLINSLEKIRSVSDSVDLDQLAITLNGSLDRVAKAHRAPLEVLKSYLKQSKHTSLSGNVVRINLPSRNLNSIEKAVVEILKTVPASDYPNLSEKLREKKFGEAAIQKSIFTSPLVYVDKSEGRRRFKFSLIGENGDVAQIDRYTQFMQRLKNICVDGTNYEQAIQGRVEQPILRDWLFEDKIVENCAICGNEYSVTSLIAAHKKKRSDCSENERTDPNIVMPLCLFGCDFMYETGYLFIQNGKVASGILPEHLTAKEKKFIAELIDKDIDGKWLVGNKSYFRSPDS